MKTLSRRRAVAVVVVGILICGAGTVVAFGQQTTTSQGVPALVGDALTMLQDLATSVAALQASVDAVQETLDVPPPAAPRQ